MRSRLPFYILRVLGQYCMSRIRGCRCADFESLAELKRAPGVLFKGLSSGSSSSERTDASQNQTSYNRYAPESIVRAGAMLPSIRERIDLLLIFPLSVKGVNETLARPPKQRQSPIIFLTDISFENFNDCDDHQLFYLFTFLLIYVSTFDFHFQSAPPVLEQSSYWPQHLLLTAFFLKGALLHSSPFTVKDSLELSPPTGFALVRSNRSAEMPFCPPIAQNLPAPTSTNAP